MLAIQYVNRRVANFVFSVGRSAAGEESGRIPIRSYDGKITSFREEFDKRNRRLIAATDGDVAFWHNAEVPPASRDFRFRGFNGHQNHGSRLPVLTRSGSQPRVSLGPQMTHKSRREYSAGCYDALIRYSRATKGLDDLGVIEGVLLAKTLFHKPYRKVRCTA